MKDVTERAQPASPVVTAKASLDSGAKGVFDSDALRHHRGTMQLREVEITHTLQALNELWEEYSGIEGSRLHLTWLRHMVNKYGPVDVETVIISVGETISRGMNDTTGFERTLQLELEKLHAA